MLQCSSAARIAAAIGDSPARGTMVGSRMPSHAGGLLSDRTSTQRVPRRMSAPTASTMLVGSSIGWLAVCGHLTSNTTTSLCAGLRVLKLCWDRDPTRTCLLVHVRKQLQNLPPGPPQPIKRSRVARGGAFEGAGCPATGVAVCVCGACGLLFVHQCRSHASHERQPNKESTCRTRSVGLSYRWKSSRWRARRQRRE